MKSSFHNIISFRPLFCSCQLRRLDSIQFLCYQAHIPAGWRLETRLEYGFWVWVLCYDRRSVGQSVLVESTHPGLTTRFLFPYEIRNTSDSYVLDSVGRPLWREDGSVFCMCRWPLPTQSFSGPSLLGLATVFYCLRFETSLFVASYDSQGHGGSIRPRLHTGLLRLQVKSKSHCDWRSVSQ
jgi:hypothetical protein